MQNIPDDPLVWIVLIVGVVVVVLFALWRGNVVEITTKPWGLKFKRSRPGEERDAENAGVSVGEKMKARGLTVEGDIVGIKTSGGGAATTDTPVNVLTEADVEDSTVKGDVAGRKESGS